MSEQKKSPRSPALAPQPKQLEVLSYPLGEDLPAPGTCLEVADGVRWLRMRLPFSLDHINLWLLRDEIDGQAGWTVVDTGIANEETRQAWTQIFEHGLDGLPILRLIVTHMHPDHIGNAHWLTQHWSTPEHPCRLWISATDFQSARLGRHTSSGHGGEEAAAFFASHGLVDPDSVAKIRQRGNYYVSMVPDLPTSYRRLMDGLEVDIDGRSWRCLAGYGHSPEHIALYCDSPQILISGDMMLPRISTNVSVTELEPEGNALALFLESIERMRALPAETLVLPSHGKPFRGLHHRIDQLLSHHRDRLAETREACLLRPSSAADMLPILFRRPLDLHQMTFAMGEAVAHLHALWHAGDLQRTTGTDGVHRFSATARQGPV